MCFVLPQLSNACSRPARAIVLIALIPIAAGGAAGADEVPDHAFATLRGPLVGQPCEFHGLIGGGLRTSFAASNCGSSIEDFMRPDSQPFKQFFRGEEPPSLPGGTAIANALRDRTFETLHPIATASGPGYESSPQIRDLVEQCRDFPPLPSVAEGSALAGVNFDLRLDRLRLGSETEVREVFARDGVKLFDLGNAGESQRLYALKASSYAEKARSDSFVGWPEANTDARRADRGILHLFLMPACLYTGGIAFASQVEVETTYNITLEYPGAKADGSDLARAEPQTRSYSNSTSGVLAELVRIDDRVFFVTRHPKRIDRSVTLLSDRSAALVQAVRSADLDDQGWQDSENLEPLRRAGLEFEVAEREAPEPRIVVWEIGVRDRDLYTIRWVQPSTTGKHMPLVPHWN